MPYPQAGRPVPCANRNHSRLNSPVRHCPQCSGVVNAAVPAKHCSEVSHATMRRSQNTYCIDCGTRLIAAH